LSHRAAEGKTGPAVIRRGFALALLALCACGYLPEGATEQGREIHALWRFTFWAALAVAVVVYGLIIWTTVRYRRRGEGTPPQFRSNIPLEIVYTIIPVLIVGVLFLLTYRTETSVETPAEEPAATVRVEAFNWSWRFTYQDRDVSVYGTPDDPPEMVVPVGEPVRIVLTATDVIHAFFVPEFLFKRDAIPGRTTRFDLRVEEPGVYRGYCAEFCGLDHWRMRFTVRAVAGEDFRSWLEEQAASA
jgi:cytochrome c oxidase subunit II